MRRSRAKKHKTLPHRVGLVVVPGFAFDSYLQLHNAFALASELTSVRPIALSIDGGLVESSDFCAVATTPITADRIDTLIFADAGPDARIERLNELADFTHAAAAIVDRVIGIGASVEVLAASTILDGKRAAVGLELADEFSSNYPKIRLVRTREFFNEADIWTATGNSSVRPLCLSFIAERWGSRVRDHVIGHVPDESETNSSNPSEEDFEAEVDDKQMKLMTALHHIQYSTESFEHIANVAGFKNLDQMRRRFLKRFGQPPQVFRRAERLGRRANDRVTKIAS